LPTLVRNRTFMKLINLTLAILLLTGSAYSQSAGEILAFNSERVANAVNITWTPSVKPETNHFEIQRSDDGVNWKLIAIMFPYEDGTVSHSYKYNDKLQPEANAYYRIRQIDINKKESFSKVILVSNGLADK
jgi:hypothetical protein